MSTCVTPSMVIGPPPMMETGPVALTLPPEIGGKVFPPPVLPDFRELPLVFLEEEVWGVAGFFLGLPLLRGEGD